MTSHATGSSTRSATLAVIFDLDGVLVSSATLHWQAFRRAFADEGRDFTFDDYLRCGVSAPREEVIRHVFGDLPEARLARLMAEKERHVREYLHAEGIDTIPGSLDFVRAARARNLKTAVASASRTPELLLAAAGATDLFDAVVGRQKVARSKPDPAVYLLAAEVLGVEPSACLVIEDSPIGIEAARRAGMRVLALATTEVEDRLAAAHGIYRSFADIPLDDWL